MAQLNRLQSENFTKKLNFLWQKKNRFLDSIIFFLCFFFLDTSFFCSPDNTDEKNGNNTVQIKTAIVNKNNNNNNNNTISTLKTEQMMFGTCLPIKFYIDNTNTNDNINTSHTNTSSNSNSNNININNNNNNNNNTIILEPKHWTCTVLGTSYLDPATGTILTDDEENNAFEEGRFQIVSLEEINTQQFCLKVTNLMIIQKTSL